LACVCERDEAEHDCAAIEARGKCLARTEPVAVRRVDHAAGLLRGAPVPAPGLAVQHQYFPNFPPTLPGMIRSRRFQNSRGSLGGAIANTRCIVSCDGMLLGRASGVSRSPSRTGESRPARRRSLASRKTRWLLCPSSDGLSSPVASDPPPLRAAPEDSSAFSLPLPRMILPQVQARCSSCACRAPVSNVAQVSAWVSSR